MPTYHLTTLKINDKTKFLEYAEKARPLLEKFGGEYLAAGRARSSAQRDGAAPRPDGRQPSVGSSSSPLSPNARGWRLLR